jgi:hypothetical protein
MPSSIRRLTPYLALVVSIAGTGALAPSVAAKKSTKKKVHIHEPAKLTATVSANGQVTLRSANGHTITRLRHGWYTVTVSVASRNADFHLTGPGTRKVTRAHFDGIVIWGVDFRKGQYRYMNDHKSRASHTLTVY